MVECLPHTSNPAKHVSTRRYSLFRLLKQSTLGSKRLRRESSKTSSSRRYVQLYYSHTVCYMLVHSRSALNTLLHTFPAKWTYGIGGRVLLQAAVEGPVQQGSNATRRIHSVFWSNVPDANDAHDPETAGMHVKL